MIGRLRSKLLLFRSVYVAPPVGPRFSSRSARGRGMMWSAIFDEFIDGKAPHPHDGAVLEALDQLIVPGRCELGSAQWRPVAPAASIPSACGLRLAALEETSRTSACGTPSWRTIAGRSQRCATFRMRLGELTAEIEALSCWLMERLGPDVPPHFTAFRPDWKMLDKPATPASTLCLARHIGMRESGRVHWKHARRRGAEHVLSSLQRAADRPRLVRPYRLEPLHCLRNPVRGRVRRPARNVGTTTTPHKSAVARRRGMSA